jgi:hypothetical protein
MCDRYGAANPIALIAAAVRPQWIEVAIDIHRDETSPPPETW